MLCKNVCTMIKLKRSIVVAELSKQTMENYNGHNHLVNDAMNGAGDQAMAYLVKRGVITFEVDDLREELNDMVENSLITINQWETMISLLKNATNGPERVTNFLRKKRRITVI